MRRLVVALMTGAVLLATSSTSQAVTIGGEPIGTVAFSAAVTVGGVNQITGIVADRNPVTDTRGLLAGYNDLTLSINWPGGLLALQSGTSVSVPSYIWTLDIMSGANRYHSLLRGVGIDLVAWEQISGEIPTFNVRLALSTDGNWYSPTGSATLLSDLGWHNTLFLEGTVYVTGGFQGLSGGTLPTLTVGGNVTLLGSPTPTSPVIPDASTVTLLATGLMPVAAVWRRMKA